MENPTSIGKAKVATTDDFSNQKKKQPTTTTTTKKNKKNQNRKENKNRKRREKEKGNKRRRKSKQKINKNAKKLRAVGFEPTPPKRIELESTSLTARTHTQLNERFWAFHFESVPQSRFHLVSWIPPRLPDPK